MVRDIVNAIYGDRPDGGPLYAADCVKVTICRMRRDKGIKIETRSGLGYRLCGE